ncbi:MAG: glycosyltransferase family 2 protein [Microcystaceae cyanobacterium]
MYRIAAYITAYEDIDAVKNCITAIKQQSYPVDIIYIIDNSTLPISHQIDNDDKLIFDHHPENIGIAEGLNISINWSIQQNYDFLWTFDQDSEPTPDALSSLINAYDKLVNDNINLGIIACLPIDKNTGYKLQGLVFNSYKFTEISKSQQESDAYECDIVITSGSLMVVSAVNNIPKINDKLFIDGVDWDLCLKLKEQNYKIYLDQNSILTHNYGTSKQITILIIKKQLTVSQYSPLRYYYICRNQTFIETRYAATQNNLTYAILSRLLNMLKKVIKIIVFDQNQMSLKLYATVKGTMDGLQGNLDKRWYN